MENTRVTATVQERKEKAIEIMKRMNIYKPYIEGFEKYDKVCFFENFSGYWVDQELDILRKMKELEKEYGLTVYAITHEFHEFGECYSFLYVGKCKEEWDYTVESEENMHYAFAYVWNKDADFCSEFGTVGVKSFCGGLRRLY